MVRVTNANSERTCGHRASPGFLPGRNPPRLGKPGWDGPALAFSQRDAGSGAGGGSFLAPATGPGPRQPLACCPECLRSASRMGLGPTQPVHPLKLPLTVPGEDRGLNALAVAFPSDGNQLLVTGQRNYRSNGQHDAATQVLLRHGKSLVGRNCQPETSRSQRIEPGVIPGRWIPNSPSWQSPTTRA